MADIQWNLWLSEDLAYNTHLSTRNILTNLGRAALAEVDMCTNRHMWW